MSEPECTCASKKCQVHPTRESIEIAIADFHQRMERKDRAVKEYLKDRKRKNKKERSSMK